jgi:tetratricopeptide (TPR) repeat protein
MPRMHLALALTLVLAAGAVLADDARECVQDKDADLAIRACSELIRVEPRNPVPYNHRGNAHRAKGDYAEAIADHTRAVELDPLYAVGYSNRCNDYVRAGDGSKALADCSKAIELNPKYPVAYFNRGLAHERLGKYDLAIADHSKAIEMSPKYARAYNARAWTYYKAKKAAQGLPDVQKALELRPDDPAILDTTGHILEAMGKRKEAIEYYRKALAKDPGLKESLEALKRLKVKQ